MARWGNRVASEVQERFGVDLPEGLRGALDERDPGPREVFPWDDIDELTSIWWPARSVPIPGFDEAPFPCVYYPREGDPFIAHFVHDTPFRVLPFSSGECEGGLIDPDEVPPDYPYRDTWLQPDTAWARHVPRSKMSPSQVAMMDLSIALWELDSGLKIVNSARPAENSAHRQWFPDLTSFNDIESWLGCAAALEETEEFGAALQALENARVLQANPRVMKQERPPDWRSRVQRITTVHHEMALRCGERIDIALSEALLRGFR